MWKNSGRICENCEKIAKKMKGKFLIDRIYKYKECPKWLRKLESILREVQ